MQQQLLSETANQSEQKSKAYLTYEPEMQFKTVIVGDSNVGKTSIFWRYIDDSFADVEQQKQTTMVDFRVKKQMIGDDLIKLYIWDTAGQERYRSVVSAYFKGSHGFIGVFDLQNIQSFQNIKDHWFRLCKDKISEAIFILVGNKSDLGQPQISQEEIIRFCEENDCHYIEVSAKTGQNVEKLFIKISEEIKKKFFNEKQTFRTSLDERISYRNRISQKVRTLSAYRVSTNSDSITTLKPSKDVKQQDEYYDTCC